MAAALDAPILVSRLSRLARRGVPSSRRRAACSACAALAVAGVVSASPSSGASLDSLRRYVDGLEAFGLDGQVLAAEGDSVLLERALGSAVAGRAVGPATRFAAGSVAKSLTAALAVRLARRGVLSLSDPLDRWLPAVPSDRRGITVRDLLAHRSGLPADADDVDEADDRDVVVRKILALPRVSAPGVAFHYSNAGYQLAAAVIEHATRQPFAALMERELLIPCGMHESGTGAEAARASADAAEGRNEWGRTGSIREWRQRWAGTGAGDLVTTAHDLWRWGRALQGAGPLTRAEIETLVVRRSSLGRGLGYGLGLYLADDSSGRTFLSLGGDVTGYHAAVWVERAAPWRVTAVVASGERQGRGLQVQAAQIALWRLLRDEPVTLPPETAQWPSDRLDALAGEWRLAGGGTLELTHDDETLRLGLSGPAAVALAFGEDTTGLREALDARAARLLRAAASGDSAALDGELLPVERDLWHEPLARAMGERVRRWGALEEVIADGTVPLPSLSEGSRTYVRLRFERGTTDASLALLRAGVIDASFGEGRPHPVLLPVAPRAEGGLVAWDLVDGRELRLEPFADARGSALHVIGPGGETIARRMPHP